MKLPPAILEHLRRTNRKKRAATPATADDARYHELFDRVPFALYTSSPDGTILDANPAMVQLLGYPDRDSLLQANAYDIFVDSHVRRAQVTQLEERELVRAYEMQLRRFDGSLIWALDYARAVKDEHGRVLFYEGALEDITERKLAGEALQASNEMLRAIIGDSPLAIVTHDLDGVVLTWNKAAERIFGWSAEEAIGSRVPFIPEEEWARFERMMRRVVTRGEPRARAELHRKRRDGSDIWINVNAAPLRSPRGDVIGILAVIADVSGRKRAEDTRRRLAEILEATPDLVGIATVDGVGLYLNPAGREMLGLAAEQQVSPRPIWDYHPGAYKALIRDEALPGAVRDGIWSGEVVFRSDSGREIPTSLVMIAHKGAGGVDHVSVIARDLTEQKKLEERVRRAQTMDAIGRLAGGIAHDFNNLLTTVIGHSELLLRYVEDDQAREDVEAIRNAGQRAASLTAQLLAFGRRQILQMHVLDLNALVTETTGRIARSLDERIDLVVELEPDLAPVRADPLQIDQVISALVENSREAMSDGGRLTVRTDTANLSLEEARQLGLEGHGRFVVLSVADTGIGMHEETLQRIFEPFFSTKRDVKGIGLGLPTVYGIIQQSGGAVTVESVPDHGTTVTVHLPAITADGSAPAFSDTAGESSPVDEAATVLLVEDEPAVLTLAGRVLRSCGYKVLEARDGSEALRAQQEAERIDLLVTDVVMPKLGGPELASQMLELRPGVRVIYMSGYADDSTVREMMADRDVPFLQKPFTASALAALARDVLADGPGRQPSERG